MRFANPQYFILLVLVPAIWLLYYMSRRARARNIARFGVPAIVTSLMPAASRVKSRVTLALTLLLVALAVLILARPRAGVGKTTGTVHGIELMIALDVSNSMRASSTGDPADVSRLQRAKLVVEKLIEHSATDKVGLIVFAGNAYMQMPITSDLRSAKIFLSNASTDMVPSQGTAIGNAINMAAQSFSPSEKTQKAIVVVTDGENFEDDAVAVARRAASAGLQVDVVGVGSETGAPIPMGDGTYLTDDDGTPVTTRLDEQGARQIAQAGGGTYVNGNAADAVPMLKRTLDTLSKTELEKVNYTRHDEQFPVFAWLALLLLVVMTLVTEAKSRWLDKFNLFNRQ